jgi:hypothetical protein
MKKTEENLISKSLKESFTIIRDKKSYFAILFLTQLAFMIVISALFVHYSIQIGENAQKVIEPLSEISPEITPVETTRILQESDAINTAYNIMVQKIIMLLGLGFLAYILLNGITWDIANLMVNEKSSFLQYEIMFGISTFIFAFVAILFSGFFLRLLTYLGNNELAALIGLLLYIIVTYFAYISFGLINKYNTKKIKEFIKHTVNLGYNKLSILIFSYLLMTVVVVLFAGIVYQLVNSAIPGMLLSLIILILTMNWAKIYFLVTVKNVDKRYKIKIK